MALVARLAGAAMALAVSGCDSSSGGLSSNPVDWWHALEGGTIAESRPPPPNADAPYPNLGTVPARPTGSDTQARGRVAQELLSDRRNAEYLVSQAPLPKPGEARPPAPAAPPPDEETSSASLDAASAPPAPAVPASASPSPAPAAPAGPVPAAPMPVPATTEAAAMPEIPDQPPPPPRLPGVSTVTAPMPPPVAPPPPKPKPGPIAGAPLAVPFALGSAVLSTGGDRAVQAFGRTRGTRAVAVTGYGDAASDDTTAQATALPLAFDRARAVAASLGRAGVPAAALRIAGEAVGHGATAKLID